MALTIYGTSKVGQTLTAHMSRWWTLSPTPTTLAYAWTRSGSEGVLGTDETYVPTVADIGATLTVTAERASYLPAVVSSAPTGAVALGVFSEATAPTISGIAQVGKPLTATAGEWAADATVAYAWERSGSTSTISTANVYTAVAADIGTTLTVTVTATREGFSPLSTTSAATPAILGLEFTTSPVPTITGTKKSGSTVTAATGAWAPSSGVAFTYVWKRATTPTGTKTTISRASSKTYRLATADKGKYITVSVTAKKIGYASTTTVSADGGTKIAR